MIRIEIKNKHKAEVEWTSGEDYQFLKALQNLIELRNKDKEHIIGLKEELM